MLKTLFVFCVLLMGCDKKTENKSEKLVGNDRDENGCIASAGYQWCEKLNKCVRPWELAKQEGFENTEENFKNFCLK